MTQTELIKAEIERMENVDMQAIQITGKSSDWDAGFIQALSELKHFIESLENEQPQGLDEAAEEESKKWGNEYFPYRGWLAQCFKAGAKWMAEQINNTGRL